MAGMPRASFRTTGAVLLFSLCVGLAAWALHALLGRPFGLAQWAMVAFLAVLTGGLHLWQEQALTADPKGFLFRFMLGLIIKLVTALLVIVTLLLLLPRAQALPLALTFALLYLLFLAFSTVRLSARSRRLPKP
jgi:cobalamin synthase